MFRNNFKTCDHLYVNGYKFALIKSEKVGLHKDRRTDFVNHSSTDAKYKVARCKREIVGKNWAKIHIFNSNMCPGICVHVPADIMCPEMVFTAGNIVCTFTIYHGFDLHTENFGILSKHNFANSKSYRHLFEPIHASPYAQIMSPTNLKAKILLLLV